MKSLTILGIFLSISFYSFGQIFNPVKWQIEPNAISEDELELIFTAKIDKDWYIYSQQTHKDGPIPTTFYFNQGNHYKLVGTTKEIGDLKTVAEPSLGSDVTITKFVGGIATFVQKIRILDGNKPIIGELEYIACNKETCTPPLIESYEIIPANLTASIGSGEMAEINSMPAIENETAFVQDCGSPIIEEGKSLWSILGLGFIGGLLALLTPCVFPMIPLTVSFFTKASGNRTKGLTNAFLYGCFIVLVYILLSIPFHLMDSINPDILNEISTNTWLNVFFFVTFMFFAFSFFGYCLLYTSPSPRDATLSRMPSSA